MRSQPHMALQRVTAPIELPVSLADAKAHLRVDTSHEDGYIADLIARATSHLDGYSGVLWRCLCTQTWDLFFDAFPCDVIRVPLPPLVSVNFVKYIDPGGTLQTLNPSAYDVDVKSDIGQIVPKETWPATKDAVNAVNVQFVAGYGAASDVPAAIRGAILLMIGADYRNRESVVDGQVAKTGAVEALLAPFRMRQL